MDDDAKTPVAHYEIDGKTASDSQFKELLTKVREIESTYVCHKMVGGGMVEFEAQDENGSVWSIQQLTQPGKFSAMATRKA